MLIRVDVLVYQNEIINDGKCHLNSLYQRWIPNSFDGDTALARVMNRMLTAVI